MAKRKTDYQTLDEVEDVIDQGVLSLNADSECSKDENFKPTAVTYLHHLGVQRNQTKRILIKTLNCIEELLTGLVATAYTGMPMLLLQLGP